MEMFVGRAMTENVMSLVMKEGRKEGSCVTMSSGGGGVSECSGSVNECIVVWNECSIRRINEKEIT